MPCAVFQKPSPTSSFWLFSVYITSFESGSFDGSWATTAFRYWSISPSRHARLQLSGIGPVDPLTRVPSEPTRSATQAAAMASVERMSRLLLFRIDDVNAILFVLVAEVLEDAGIGLEL